MAGFTIVRLSWLCALVCLITYASPAAAFGAGNIASISKLEGHNWRHGDIEDMLKTIAFLYGKKWTSMLVKRVYFGNWLRDYSQAMDVGTLKSVQADAIRTLVWVLSFLTFGYATEEFEVTSDRLGVYRPEEHVDNPKDYADNQDARKFDPRLRGPVQSAELEVDRNTGMKNYIANESLGIATSSGYVRFSLTRSIHFGRLYTNGASGTKGHEADLCEALRCLGQALHTLEDVGAHTNYCELALREMGYRNVFPHTGVATEMNFQGRRAFPLVTGTFGMVDFIHSVLGEATDHFAQSEVEELDKTLASAQASNAATSNRSGGDESGGASSLTSLLSQVPGAGSLCREAESLQATSQAQQQMNEQNRGTTSEMPAFDGPPGSTGGPPKPGIPGLSANFDPAKTIKQIYPILVFRDKVARAIAATIEKIPGLETLVEKISETVTLFVLSLLAPFIRPIIDAVSKSVKFGSSGVIDASGKHQYGPWTDPNCTDPTHSLLSKDHFGNILNEPAGQVAASILQYVAPRVLYAWEHPDIPVEQVLNDVVRVFHHPALRDQRCEIHNNMFAVVERWARSRPGGGSDLDHILSSDSVRAGRNVIAQQSSAGFSSGQGFLGGIGSSIPTSNSISNTFNSALNNRFGSIMRPLQSMGRAAGLSRDGGDLESEIGQRYPGMETAYDQTRPPPGPQSVEGNTLQPSHGFASGMSRYPQRSPSPFAGPPPSGPPMFGYGMAPPESQMGYGAYQGQPPPPGAFGYYPPEQSQSGYGPQAQGGYGGPMQGPYGQQMQGGYQPGYGGPPPGSSGPYGGY